MDSNNIHPALRDPPDSATTSPAVESIGVHTSIKTQSPLYQDHTGTNDSYTSALLSAGRPYAESPLNDQHRQSYPPLTPQSTHTGDPNSVDDLSQTHGEHPDLKRPRACEACKLHF